MTATLSHFCFVIQGSGQNLSNLEDHFYVWSIGDIIDFIQKRFNCIVNALELQLQCWSIVYFLIGNSWNEYQSESAHGATPILLSKKSIIYVNIR